MNQQDISQALNNGLIVKVYDDIVFFESVYFKKENDKMLTSTNLIDWYNATVSINAYNTKNAKVVGNENNSN